MVFSFIHLADVHLGYKQYGLDEREEDYLRALRDIIEYGIENKVNAILCAGDLFDKRSPSASTLCQTMHLLQRVKDAGIKFIAIEGNHDKPLLLGEFTFLQLLHTFGYITLLKPRFEDGVPIIDGGCCLEFDQVRIVGLGYQGSLLRSRLPIIAEKVRPSEKYTVVMIHAGVEEEASRIPMNIRLADLEPFKGKVNYFALGHIHKCYEKDDWIYNPGSPDYCDIYADDAMEKRTPRYFLHIKVENGKARVKRCETSARLIYRWVLNADKAKTSDEVYRRLADLLSRKKVTVEQDVSALPDRARRAPLIKLVVEGKIPFDRYAIDAEFIKTEVSKSFGCLHVIVENYAAGPGAIPLAPQAVLDRAKIERKVFERLAIQELRKIFGRNPSRKQIELAADLAEEFKTQAREVTPELNQRLLELIEERWGTK